MATKTSPAENEISLREEAAQRAYKLLGGNRLLGRHPVRSRFDFIPLMRDGFPYASLLHVMDCLALTPELTAASLHLAVRTLARRKDEGRLDVRESERLLRLAEIGAMAIGIFGDDATRWLVEPIRALGGASPISMLDTDVGAEAVRDELGRIEHGVFT